MNSAEAIGKLLVFMAEQFDHESTDGGSEASLALRNAATLPDLEFATTTCPKPDLIQSAVSHKAIDGINALLNALPFLEWFDPSEAFANMASDKSSGMMPVEVLGPDGMIDHPTIRIGLYVQDPNFFYPARRHPAEESYIMIAGEGFWSAEGQELSKRALGEVIFHPSNISHANETRDVPMVAFWRWSGDIDYDHYYPE